MKTYPLLAALCCAPLLAAPLRAAETLTSPDGHLAVHLDVTAEGVPTYSITLDADTLLCPSPWA